MFQITGALPGLQSIIVWIAQVGDPGIDTPEEAALVFSGPNFFIALIAGVVLAFAFQLLLTNLSVAAGISYLGHSSDDSEDQGTGSLGGTIRKIGFALGLWTLVTVTIALFIACFLAVKLSLLNDGALGAIVALVIWATYFSLLVWVSSTTVGSLIGSVVNTATSGFQALLGTATAALGMGAVNNQVVSTAEAAVAAVRRELGSGLDPLSVRETVEDYLQTLRPPGLDLQSIRGEFERLLNDPELRSLAGSDRLRNIGRETFVDLVRSRTDLSKQEIDRIVDQLESVWRQTLGQQRRDPTAELVDYLKSARPEELRSRDLSSKLDQLIAEVRASRGAQPEGTETSSGGQSSGMLAQAGSMLLSTLTGSLMGRTDLSDLDVQTILDRLQTLRGKLTEQVSGVTGGQTYNTIRADVENYLLNTYSWEMTPDKFEQDFREVIYDPAAAPGVVRQQLEQLSRAEFANLLQQRGVFSQAEIARIADQAERIRQEVLTTLRAAELQEGSQELRRRVEQYLLTVNKSELSPEAIQRDFKPLLEDPDADYTELSIRLSQFDLATFRQLLESRQDLTPEEVVLMVRELENARDQVLGEAQGLQDHARAEAQALQVKLESYLRNTNKAELNPEGIKRDLRTLLDDPQAGLAALRTRLAHFDRDTLVQLLSQRQDLSEAEVNQIIDQVEAVRSDILHAPQILANRVRDQYDQTTSTLADYLRNTNREELNPEGIKRDLNTLLNDPKTGTMALRRRLAQIDRETLVKLLSQRQDLSEEQVNQIIDQVQENIRSIIRAPRRLANRAQERVQNFEATLESYLRNTNKAELNPEGIKRDLQLLLNDPRVGLESLVDRFSQFDRSTFVALLSQREDISEAEANRIADQMLSVRDQFVEQVRSIQRRIQSVIDGIFARIRNYLNSLERPELNYDGIKRDVRQLFDDPQAGFDALRDRLSSFDRDTLVAILSSRQDISEADANRIIDQIEGARNTVLQRAERIQQEAQRRLEAVKLQAQQQAEETRKAAGTAAWWLFGTALTSAAASAIAGAIAVTN